MLKKRPTFIQSGPFRFMMYRYTLSFVLIFLFSCSAIRQPKVYSKPEFRGVWIATVGNIDWPKHPLDNLDKKKRDFIEILDFYKRLNFNAAIVQVRTAGDALYPSSFAPWSKYISGKQGQKPEGFESPLEWMIKETHKRGMEFHAWLNPYRATVDLDTLSLSQEHDFFKHPDWMVKYGKKYYYNPGLPEVRQNFDKVVSELVSNYEIDAIHFDDYFYPYKIEDEVFNDSLTFKAHQLPNQNLEDWRRSNVDSLVKNVYHTIKSIKPWVQFGISPFGVWKNNSTDPKGSATKAGQTTYEDLYADPLLWMEQGWLDYLAPQAYWSMEYPPAAHKTISQWWSNTTNRTNLYMGNGTYKIKNNPDKAWNKKNEIPEQLQLARSLNNINGNIFFSAKSLMGKHDAVVKIMKWKFYANPAQNPFGSIKINRELSIAKVETLNTANGVGQVCISHKDSVPRFLKLYQSKSGFKEKDWILIQKRYLSESDENGCIDMVKTKRQLGITLSDALGNESDVHLISRIQD